MSAWHQLGTDVSHETDVACAMEDARLLGWDLRLLPAGAMRGKKFYPHPSHSMVVRDSMHGQQDVLGVVSKSYRLRHNEDTVPLLREIAAECGTTPAAAGTLASAAQVFTTLRLPGYTRVGDDEVVTYLTSVHSHDGTVAHSVLVTPCHVRTGALLAVHAVPVTTAAEVVDAAFTWLDGFQETAHQLHATKMSVRQLEKLAWARWGAPDSAAVNTQTRAANKVAGMVARMGTGATAWDALVALCAWWDLDSPVRGEHREAARAVNAVLAPKFKAEALALLATTSSGRPSRR